MPWRVVDHDGFERGVFDTPEAAANAFDAHVSLEPLSGIATLIRGSEDTAVGFVEQVSR